MLVVNNGALRSLEGLGSLTHVLGHLSVRNNSALTSLAGSNVSFVQLSVEVRRCCPHALHAARYLSLSQHLPRPSPPPPSRLPARATREAAHTGRRQVRDNGALTSLHGLHHLTQLGPLCAPSSQPPSTFPLSYTRQSPNRGGSRCCIVERAAAC